MPKVSEQKVLSALKQCMDPEIPLSVVDLGLIYGIDIDDNNNVNIRMTMTTPGCPLHNTLVRDVKNALSKVEEIGDINVEIVWDPPWTPERMSAEAKTMIYGAGRRESLRFAIDFEKSRPLKQGTLSRQEDGSLILMNEQGQGFMVNDALVEFWNMCDGSRSINEMIDEFSSRLKVPRIDIEREVVTLVQQMIEARLLKV